MFVLLKAVQKLHYTVCGIICIFVCTKYSVYGSEGKLFRGETMIQWIYYTVSTMQKVNY